MSTYAWILLATISFPILLSFDRRVGFVKDWPKVLAAALIVAPVFVVWDALAVQRGDWGFSAIHIGAISLFGLPIEELLFFILIPFACLFIARCLNSYFPIEYGRPRSWPYLIAGLCCLAAIPFAWPRFYSASILGFSALLFLMMAGPWRRAAAGSHFWLTQAISFVPFLIVNGFLTGIPVVSYSPEAIFGFRLFTIPVEDALYCFVLVGANLLVFNSLPPRRQPLSSKGRAVVIGAGLGGLAAAARLARLGWQTTLFEATTAPGGKAGSFEQAGFRFDTGPSLLTMPAVFDELFAFCGEERRDHLELVPLQEICAYWWSDGSCLVSRPVPEMITELATRFGEDPERVAAYFKKAALIYRITAGLFLERSLQAPDSFFSRSGLRGILGLPRMALAISLHGLHRRYFKDIRTIQLFDRLATYNGSDPYRTSGTMAIIAHVEYGLGAFAVRGGIRSIPLAIEALGRRMGAGFNYGQKVDRIVIEDGRVRGVMVAGVRHEAELVISNTSPGSAYNQLLARPRDRLARRQSRLEPSSSGLVFYWGIKAVFPGLGVNNTFFSAHYEEDFRAIFGTLRCPDDPTIYLNISSKIDAADAPSGCENWFVLINAPHDAGQDWLAETALMRQVVLSRLSGALGQDIAPLIVTEQVMTPADLRQSDGSNWGGLYGAASNSRIAAFLRHPNRHPTISGLYFCGGSVHPGGGMPLVLGSARIAVDLVQRYRRYHP